jgi:tRNA pseudouridine32 synthase/23S rRNA pseudouridine746 synthase
MDSSQTLPMHLGVSASRVSLPSGHWPTVLAFLCERFPAVEPQEWLNRCETGLVMFADGRPVSPLAPYQAQQHVFYYRDVPQEAALPESAEVLFEDNHVLVADKPHFMPVTPGGRYLQSSLLVQLKRLTGCESLTPIHRIDRETAGLVVFCKHAQNRDAYHALFRQHQVRKWYQAVAAFNPDVQLPLVYRSRLVEADPFFLTQEVPGEPNSETHVSLLNTVDDLALYQLQPLTGQRHQLRVHMMRLGLPIAGDQFYPKVLRGPHEADDFSQCLQLLAQRIAFKDPVTGEERDWQSRRSLQITHAD